MPFCHFPYLCFYKLLEFCVDYHVVCFGFFDRICARMDPFRRVWVKDVVIWSRKMVFKCRKPVEFWFIVLTDVINFMDINPIVTILSIVSDHIAFVTNEQFSCSDIYIWSLQYSTGSGQAWKEPFKNKYDVFFNWVMLLGL